MPRLEVLEYDPMARYEDEFRAAGMSIKQIRLRGKKIHKISTQERHDWARVVWSLLDQRRVYIRERHRSYETYYPTTFWDRLRLDGNRQFMVVAMASLALLPLVVVLAARLGAFAGIELGPTSAVAFMAVPIAILLLLHRFLGEARALDLDTILLRLLLGLGVGLVWIAAASWPSPVDVLGAVWVFTVTNVVWVATVGADRYWFGEYVNRVGGLLSTDEAERLLDSWKHSSLSAP